LIEGDDEDGQIDQGLTGSWEAEVVYTDGSKEVLPCLHQHFWCPGGLYDDPWSAEARRTGKFAKHTALIREMGRAILTTDAVDETKNRGFGFFQRTGYVGVFDIADFVLDDSGMRLRFVARYPSRR
jgi:hypothetical protein